MQPLPVPSTFSAPATPPLPNPPALLPVVLPGPGQDNSHLLPWVQPVMCWKGHLIIDRYGPPLPLDRCCKCNAPTEKTLRRTFTQGGSAALLLLLLFPFLLPIALLSFFTDRNRATVEFGICHRCANRRLLAITLGASFMIGAAPLFVQAWLAANDSSLLWLIGGVASLLIGAIVVAVTSGFGTPKRVDKRWVIVKTGGKKFHDSLPQSPIPQF